jgi:site-specific recombinase XerD
MDNTDLHLLSDLWYQARWDFLYKTLTAKGTETDKLSHNTHRAYQTTLNQFFYGFHELWEHYTPSYPWEARPTIAEKWKIAMIKIDLTASSINQKLSTLKGFYDFVRSSFSFPYEAHYNNLISLGHLFFEESNQKGPLTLWPYSRKNPFDPLTQNAKRIPIGIYDRSTCPTTEETKQILRQIDQKTLLGLRDYAILYTLVTTCRRSSEILNLKWQHITPLPNGSHQFTYRYKGGHRRQAEMTNKVYTSIQTYLRAAGRLQTIQPHHHIFTGLVQSGPDQYKTKPDHPLNHSTIDRAFKKYARLAHIDKSKAHLHALRHAGARARIIQMKTTGQIDYQEIQKVLGHQNINTTMIYCKSVLDDPGDIGQNHAADEFAI